MNLDALNLSKLSDDEKRELYELLRLKDIRTKRNRLTAYKPYAKQTEFHEAGSRFRERLFMAGNQLGKTWAGARSARGKGASPGSPGLQRCLRVLDKRANPSSSSWHLFVNAHSQLHRNKQVQCCTDEL